MVDGDPQQRAEVSKAISDYMLNAVDLMEVAAGTLWSKVGRFRVLERQLSKTLAAGEPNTIFSGNE